MGQQQLLLIVLGVIIVGIAVVLGIYAFQGNAVEQKRNILINESIHIASLALQYYQTSKLFGGGAYSFTGFEIPTSLKVTVNGSYSPNVSSKRVEITGTGNEVVTSGDSIKVRTIVTPDTLYTEIIN